MKKKYLDDRAGVQSTGSGHGGEIVKTYLNAQTLSLHFCIGF